MVQFDVFNRVREVIVDQMGVDEESITRETTVDDLEVGSLDLLELIFALEEEFDIEIPDEDCSGFKTVGDVVDYLTNNA